MRLFIGIPMPEEYKRMLGDIQRAWKDKFQSRLTWTRPENWHLTLKFLGEVDEERLPDLKEFLDDFSFRELTLQAGSSGFFGSKGQYRVAWLGVEGEVQRLAELAHDMDQGLAGLGFEPEKKAFKAHLTLARIKKFVKSDPWRGFSSYVDNMDWPSFTAQQIVLWQSSLTPKGPEYKALKRCILSQQIHTYSR